VKKNPNPLEGRFGESGFRVMRGNIERVE